MGKKKTKKFRGSMTHGRGKKAGRGSGLRGGRGNAGFLKHRRMHLMKKNPDYFGKHGFKRPQNVVKKANTINVGQLEEKYPNKKQINLKKEGYDKLLGSGTINTKYKITVDNASSKAIKKVEKTGGEVELPKKPETKSEQKEEKESSKKK